MPQWIEKASWVAGIVGTLFAAYQLFMPDQNSAHTSSDEKSVQQTFQQTGNNNTQVGTNTGTVIVTTASEARTIDEPIDVPGNWNQATALEIAFRSLKRTVFPQDNFGPPPYSHELISEYNMLYKDKQGIVLVTQTVPENHECHACAPYLSFFEFEKRLRGWKLIHSDTAAIQNGSWGNFSASNLSVRVIGSNQYGAFIEGGYTAQGHTNGGTTLYTRIGDKFREILSIATHESTSIIKGEGKSWDSTISIVPTETGFYDLVIERMGDLEWTDVPDQFIDDLGDKNGKVRPRDKFAFDGTRYKRSDFFR